MAFYDGESYQRAVDRFFDEPTALTDDDLAQIELVVGAKTADIARARRNGLTEALSDAEQKNRKRPVSLGFMLDLFRRDSMLLASYRYRINEGQRKIESLTLVVDALQKRITELERR